MKSINFTKIGAATLIFLGIVYIGNLAMKTLPTGSADGPYQYKMVSLQMTEAEAGGAISAMEKMSYDEKKSSALSYMEKKINDTAKDGWEYVQLFGDDMTVIFRKKL